MINIAIVHSVAKIGGAERVSQMLLTGISSDKVTGHLVCPEGGALESWSRDNGIKFSILPMEQPGLSNAIASIKQALIWNTWLRKNNIDIVHTADPYCTRAVTLGAKLAGVKVLSHYHFPFSYDHLSWLLKRLPKPSVSVFCSEELRDNVGEHLTKIAPEMGLITIHNGVDVARFIPSPTPESAFIKIGIIANLQKRKGHDEFLNMASILSSKHNNLQFHIIGGDLLEEPREDYLKAKAEGLGLTNITTFHGQVPDVLSRINSLDIVVCASHQEAFPIAILEAMAMRKAIVSTNVNGIPEAITDGETGLLVPAFDAEKLALAVESLLIDVDKRKELAAAARASVVKDFNMQVFIAKFERLYKNVHQGELQQGEEKPILNSISRS
jgi:glycosyltransferase involved in cell wall biosynthesis